MKFAKRIIVSVRKDHLDKLLGERAATAKNDPDLHRFAHSSLNE
jgi:hypothetical protein